MLYMTFSIAGPQLELILRRSRTQPIREWKRDRTTA